MFKTKTITETTNVFGSLNLVLSFPQVDVLAVRVRDLSNGLRYARTCPMPISGSWFAIIMSDDSNPQQLANITVTADIHYIERP